MSRKEAVVIDHDPLSAPLANAFLYFASIVGVEVLAFFLFIAFGAFGVGPFDGDVMAGESIYFDLATLCEQAELPLDEIRAAAKALAAVVEGRNQVPQRADPRSTALPTTQKVEGRR